MKKIISVLGLISILLLIVWFWDTDNETDRKWRISNKVVSKFARKVKNEYNLTFSGQGGAEEDDKIKRIKLVFDSNRAFRISELPEARKLLLDLSSRFLDDINGEVSLRPFLSQYPFTKKNITISILNYVALEDKAEFLVYLLMSDGRLLYAKDSEKEFGPFSSVHEETYEEALKIVAASKENEQNSFDSK